MTNESFIKVNNKLVLVNGHPITINGSSSNLQENKAVTITSNGTATITPDEGYDGLSSVDVTVNVSGGGSSGGGYLKGICLENTNGMYFFNADCSNVTFKDCSVDNAQIVCTQEIRDAIENGEGNSHTNTTWMML